MAITSGLNVRLYVQGNDLSGDANSLDGAGYTVENFDTTVLNQSAVSRVQGRSDGSISVDGFFDNASNKIHATFTSNSGKLPTADQIILVPFGASVGDNMVGISSKEADYNVSQSMGSAITVSSTFSGNGVGGEFGEMLTAHDDTHSSATDGTAIDNSASSASGGSGYVQIISLGSGTVDVKIQDSSDNVTFTDLITFTSAGTSDVPTAERVEVTGTVERYIRVSTSGTFTDAKIAVGFARF